jgi:hypothetical protein
MREQLYFVASLVVLVLAADGLSGRDQQANPQESVASPPARHAAPDVVTGFEAHIDPNTRRFTDAPTHTQLQRPAVSIDDEMNFSPEGLEERPSAVEGGGIVVDLRGRFHNTSVATINGDGTVSAPCLSASAECAAEHLSHPHKAVEGGDGE